jgi:GMP synthase (glutamine-hydrolysing)
MSCIAVLITGDPIETVSRIVSSFTSLIRDTVGPVDATWTEIDLRTVSRLPDPREFAACVIAGSPHSVTERAAWMLNAEAYLRQARAVGTGLFGICFGHQLMASAFGGQVVLNPKGREMGLCPARPLCSNTQLQWPTETIEVFMTHSDTVSTVPPNAHVLAATEREANAAIDYGERCLSTQFHPEFTPNVLRCYIEHYRQQMQAQGDDVELLVAGLRETPNAQALLRRFIQLAVEHDARRIQRCAS